MKFLLTGILILIAITLFSQERGSTVKKKITDSVKSFKIDTLPEVIITAKRIAVKIKKDTIEFNASAFETKPNGRLEDLLRKLPGVEVDAEGNITTQGEKITKIVVDGKEFFSNDPKIATKNLRSDMVESVQVFDDKSEQAKFSKIDDGKKQKTINIKLKKDKNTGYFGNATTGIGTHNRYTGNLMLNKFSSTQKISLLGGANNVNLPGADGMMVPSSGNGINLFSLIGAADGLGFGNNGNTQTWNGGINYSNEVDDKINISSNYIISNSKTSNNNNSFRESLFPNDSVTHASKSMNLLSNNTNHALMMNLRYKIDSMNSIMLFSNFSAQYGKSAMHSNDSTYSISPKEKYVAILSNNNTIDNTDNWSLSNMFLFTHRFQKPGRTFSLVWSNSNGKSKGDGYNRSAYIIYNGDGSINNQQDINQRSFQKSNTSSNSIRTSITEGIGKDKVLGFDYEYTNTKNTADKKTFDYNNGNDKYETINNSLTNYFENYQIGNRFGSNISFKKERYNFQIGAAINFATLKSKSFFVTADKDSMMKQTYINIFPTAMFNYKLGNRNLMFYYYGYPLAPSITQLQNVLDVSDPLQQKKGNPDLKQEFDHYFMLNYTSFKPTNFISANIMVAAVDNKIINSIDSTGKGIQLIVPQNISGAYNSSMAITANFPLKQAPVGKSAPMNLSLTTMINYNKDISLLYKQKNFTKTFLLSQGLKFNINIEDKLDLALNTNFTYNNSSYTVQQSLSNNYLTQNYKAEVCYQLPGDIQFNTDFSYVINSGRSAGYNGNISLWNANIVKPLFKEKSFEFKLAVQDILNQNKSINRTVKDNYYEDTYTNILRRFFMLSITYNLNKFKSNNLH